MMDAFIGPTRIDDRKPYSFSTYHGEEFVDAHRDARSAWGTRLQEAGANPERFAAIQDWRSPRDDTGRRHALDAWLQRTATEAAQSQPIEAAAWCERIARAFVEADLPLAEDPLSNWSYKTIERWVQRFEAFGCVHALYDLAGRRVMSDPNRTSVLVRLAFATGWASVSASDPAQKVIFLNALLKILDLVQAQVMHGDSELSEDERDFALAAIMLEQRVLDGVALRTRQLREGTTS